MFRNTPDAASIESTLPIQQGPDPYLHCMGAVKFVLM